MATSNAVIPPLGLGGPNYDGFPVVTFGPNLLTPSQSDFEDGTTGGWAANSNCTIANSTAQANTGTHSLALTSVAAGSMLAQLSSFIPVTPGATYVLQAFFRANTLVRNVQLRIAWFNAAFGSLGSTVPGAVALPQDSNSAWTMGFISGPVAGGAGLPAIAPANAVFAEIQAGVNNTAAAAEVHYLDTVYFTNGLFFTP